jgi:hypothetical protein
MRKFMALAAKNKLNADSTQMKIVNMPENCLKRD